MIKRNKNVTGGSCMKNKLYEGREDYSQGREY